MLVMFFSTPDLRGPSTDRPETLPHDQKPAEFYNPPPKTWGGGRSPKNLGPKNMLNFGQFWTCIIKFSQFLIMWQSFRAIGRGSSENAWRNKKTWGTRWAEQSPT